MPRLALYNLTATNAVALSSPPTDPFTARLVKYVPAESIAVFLALNTAVTANFKLNQDGSSSVGLDGWFWGATIVGFAIILLGTPFYLWRSRTPGKPWIVNTTISTIAFVLWSYSLGGTLFVATHTFNAFVAGLIAPIFTFVAPAVLPKK